MKLAACNGHVSWLLCTFSFTAIKALIFVRVFVRVFVRMYVLIVFGAYHLLAAKQSPNVFLEVSVSLYQVLNCGVMFQRHSTRYNGNETVRYHKFFDDKHEQA